jgi:hypothetical protein
MERLRLGAGAMRTPAPPALRSFAPRTALHGGRGSWRAGRDPGGPGMCRAWGLGRWSGGGQLGGRWGAGVPLRCPRGFAPAPCPRAAGRGRSYWGHGTEPTDRQKPTSCRSHHSQGRPPPDNKAPFCPATRTGPPQQPAPAQQRPPRRQLSNRARRHGDHLLARFHAPLRQEGDAHPHGARRSGPIGSGPGVERRGRGPTPGVAAQVGLDAAGKTTILYKLKLGEIVTTIPTIGEQGWGRGEKTEGWTQIARKGRAKAHAPTLLPCMPRLQRRDGRVQEHLVHRVGRGRPGQGARIRVVGAMRLPACAILARASPAAQRAVDLLWGSRVCSRSPGGSVGCARPLPRSGTGHLSLVQVN